MHYRQKGTPCNVEGCDKPIGDARGMCPAHYVRWKKYGDTGFRPIRTRTPAERFAAYTATGEGCWEWTGPKVRDGYGCFFDGVSVKRAHRVAYEQAHGPIPTGLEIDHLCRNRACVRPDHLELVSHRVNVLRSSSPSAIAARQTQCKRGHEFTPDNIYWTRNGHRTCRACVLESQRRRRH